MEYNSLQAWLLGDSGYACKPWLLTPIPIPQTPQEVRYNAAHKTTRCIVERCIGVLKSRFRWVFIKLNPFLSESNLCIQLYRCHSIQIKKKPGKMCTTMPEKHWLWFTRHIIMDNYFSQKKEEQHLWWVAVWDCICNGRFKRSLGNVWFFLCRKKIWYSPSNVTWSVLHLEKQD